MFEKNTYEERLQVWHDFRNTLENSDDPIQDVLDFYNCSPRVSIHTDPWTKDMWPNPWELVKENQYCQFTKLLGICYTLQLTERFSSSNFEIHIGVVNETSTTYYLLIVDDIVINLEENYVDRSKIPDNFISQMVYNMAPLH